MAYSFTDVDHIDLRVDGSYYDQGFKLMVSCNAKYYTAAKQYHPCAIFIRIYKPFACCGMRTMTGMGMFLQAKEFQTPEFMRQLAEFLDTNIGYKGGNVSFVLNTAQRRAFAPVLAAMDTVGRGVQELQSFRNFNMENTNYLYNWTYRGRKIRQKEGVVNVPVGA